MPKIELFPLTLALPAGMKLSDFEEAYVAEGGTVYHLTGAADMPMVTWHDLETIASVMEEAGIDTPCLVPAVTN